MLYNLFNMRKKYLIIQTLTQLCYNFYNNYKNKLINEKF